MTTISISPALKAKCSNIVLSCIGCNVEIAPSSEALLQEINDTCKKIEAATPVTSISQIPAIAASRKAYKALGKDPSRYRLSAEALTRRIVKGKGLYHINNIVDLINLTSISSGFSIGGFNADAIRGNVLFDIGQKEPYEAIGRGHLNIENLPALRDEISAFGTPTSDSTRTMVTNETTRFLMTIISFDGAKGLDAATQIAVRLLTTYASATDVETWIVS